MNINFAGNVPRTFAEALQALARYQRRHSPMTLSEARSEGAEGGIYDMNSKCWTGVWLDALQFNEVYELALAGKLAPHLQLRRIR